VEGWIKSHVLGCFGHISIKIMLKINREGSEDKNNHRSAAVRGAHPPGSASGVYVISYNISVLSRFIWKWQNGMLKLDLVGVGAIAFQSWWPVRKQFRHSTLFWNKLAQTPVWWKTSIYAENKLVLITHKTAVILWSQIIYGHRTILRRPYSTRSAAGTYVR